MARTLTILLIIVLGLLILLPVQVEAGCGFPIVSGPIVNGPIYSTPVTSYEPPVHVVKEVVVEKEITPIAVPVVVPATTFQYLPALGLPAAGGCAQAAPAAGVAATATQTTAATTATTTTAAAPAVAQSTNVSTPMPAATPSANSTQQIDNLIRQRLEAIIKEQMTGNSTPSGPPPIIDENSQSYAGNVYSPMPVEQPQQQPQLAMQQIHSISVANLQQNCISCHGNGKKSGGVQLFDIQGRFAPNVSKQQIVDAITPDPRTGLARMPKNKAALGESVVTILKQWKAMP